MPYSVSLATGSTLNPDPQLGQLLGNLLREERRGRRLRDSPLRFLFKGVNVRREITEIWK